MSGRVEIIGEVSSNHGGDLSLAKEFIWRSAEAGADWVKFQHTRVQHLRPDDPQYAWFQRSEFSVDQFAALKETCTQAGTKFLTTVYHAADVPEVASLGLEAIKIGSGEAGEAALVQACRETFPRVIIAKGIPGLMPRADHAHACEWLRSVSKYPAPPWMCEQTAYASYNGFVAPLTVNYVGWSDHCIGLDICQHAIWRGARIIEKHVQLPTQARPPRPWEATMAELKELRQWADDDPQRFLGRWQHA